MLYFFVTRLIQQALACFSRLNRTVYLDFVNVLSSAKSEKTKLLSGALCRASSFSIILLILVIFNIQFCNKQIIFNTNHLCCYNHMLCLNLMHLRHIDYGWTIAHTSDSGVTGGCPETGGAHAWGGRQK